MRTRSRCVPPCIPLPPQTHSPNTTRTGPKHPCNPIAQGREGGETLAQRPTSTSQSPCRWLRDVPSGRYTMHQAAFLLYPQRPALPSQLRGGRPSPPSRRSSPQQNSSHPFVPRKLSSGDPAATEERPWREWCHWALPTTLHHAMQMTTHGLKGAANARGGHRVLSGRIWSIYVKWLRGCVWMKARG